MRIENNHRKSRIDEINILIQQAYDSQYKMAESRESLEDAERNMNSKDIDTNSRENIYITKRSRAWKQQAMEIEDFVLKIKFRGNIALGLEEGSVHIYNQYLNPIFRLNGHQSRIRALCSLPSWKMASAAGMYKRT